MRWWQHAILTLGVSICLIAAFLMVWGDPILGEDHAGIATVIGIVGIGLIGPSGAIYAGYAARAKPELTHANFAHHTGIATVIGIVGIGIITKAKKGSL